MPQTRTGRLLVSTCLTLAGIPVGLAAAIGPSYNGLGLLPLLIVLVIYAGAAEVLTHPHRLRAKTRRRIAWVLFVIPGWVAMVDSANGSVKWGIVSLVSIASVVAVGWVLLRRDPERLATPESIHPSQQHRGPHSQRAAAGGSDY